MLTDSLRDITVQSGTKVDMVRKKNWFGLAIFGGTIVPLGVMFSYGKSGKGVQVRLGQIRKCHTKWYEVEEWVGLI